MVRKNIILIVFFWLLMPTVFLVSAPEPVGKVASLEGKGTITRNKKKLLIKKGMDIFQGDEVNTQTKKTIVQIGFKDGTAISLSGKTNLVIKKKIITAKKSTTLLKLLKGKVRSKVKKLQPGSDYKVATKTAVAGVRGTDFVVEKHSPPKILCLSGKVEAKPALNFQDVPGSTSIPVLANQMITGEKDGFTKPIPIPENILNNIKKETPIKAGEQMSEKETKKFESQTDKDDEKKEEGKKDDEKKEDDEKKDGKDNEEKKENGDSKSTDGDGAKETTGDDGATETKDGNESTDTTDDDGGAADTTDDGGGAEAADDTTTTDTTDTTADTTDAADTPDVDDTTDALDETTDAVDTTEVTGDIVEEVTDDLKDEATERALDVLPEPPGVPNQ